MTITPDITFFQAEAQLAGFYRQLKVTVNHPVARLPSLDQVNALLGRPGGRQQLSDLLNKREEAILKAEHDPLRYGWKPEIWTHAARLLDRYSELLVMGGNRSTKTEFAAWYSVADLVRQPNRIWGFFHSSMDASIRLQHPRVHKYLPPEVRSLGKQGQLVYVCYKEKTGFSDSVFILPNGSRGFFFNYMQDRRVLEGYEFDGAWCDELVPVDFLDAIRFRLITRRGRLLVTFTPVEGYTVTVANFLAGAQPVAWQPSPLLNGRNVPGVPAGHMPLEMACARREARVMFFFTSENLFNPYDELVKKLDGAPDREIKMRAYGWPEKLTGTAFPKFGQVHILKRQGDPPPGLVPPRPWTNLYPRLPQAGTNYVVADPGTSKNWFIKWYRVGPDGFTYIYREFPDWQRFGPWAMPADKADGKPGPAQRIDFAKGIVELKGLILEAEGWTWNDEKGCWLGEKAEPILLRLIDPRLGGAEVPTVEDGTSFIQMFDEEQRDSRGRLIGPTMEWVKAPSGRILDGLQLINDRLNYNDELPVSIMNCPRLYVVEDCLQSIYALREYTGADGEKGAMKDIVDPDRYFFKADLRHTTPEMLECRGPRRTY